jgi:chemotaxis protein methyltransferase CheR
MVERDLDSVVASLRELTARMTSERREADRRAGLAPRDGEERRGVERRAGTGERRDPGERPGPGPDTPAAPLSAGRQAALQRLMAAVEANFGIRPSPAVERKLERALRPLTDDALGQWVEGLLALPASHSEWTSCVESLTVHETYFNRDKEMLATLKHQVLFGLIEHKRERGGGRIRIWSAGCSTGEETYSVTMLLLESLREVGLARLGAFGDLEVVPPWNIEVLGTDLSGQAIRAARHATYADFGLGSFRDLGATERRYFEPAPHPGGVRQTEHYRVLECVRRFVRFERHNLVLDAPPLRDVDLVLCRNVLIYFDDPVKRRVQASLADALAPRGVLVMGGVDVLLVADRFDQNVGSGGTWYVKR